MSEATLVMLKNDLKALKLSTMAKFVEEHLRQAMEKSIDYGEFLLELTSMELRIRAENRLKRRIREAKFPLLKPLETFDIEAASGLDVRLFRELATCGYIKEHRNIIFLGKSC